MPTTTERVAATPVEVSTGREPVPEEAQPDQGATGSRRLLILLHGEKAADDLLRQAISKLRSEGYQITVRVTYEPGDVDRLVSEALALRSADTLIAAGGDGTINEVVAAMLKHTGGLKDTRATGAGVEAAADGYAYASGETSALAQLSVGILPMGTSNDFAATTGIPQDPYESLKLATRNDTIRPLDVGLLNGEVFMNTATIGASADIGAITSSSIKKLLGPAAFLFTGMRALRSWKPVPSVLYFPASDTNTAEPVPADKEEEEAKALVEGVAEDMRPARAKEGQAGGNRLWIDPHAGAAPAAAKTTTTEKGDRLGELSGVPLLHMTAANNRQVASMVSVAPNALLDDGMLDCVYLVGNAGSQLRTLLGALFWGFGNTKLAPHLLRVPWIEVVTEKPLPWSLDGEPMPQPAATFRFSLLHRAIKFHLPDDRMLVAGHEASLERGQGKRRRRFRGLPVGKLRPPTLAQMLSVVRFRKKVDWKKALRQGVARVVKTLVVASLGGLAVHWWHNRRGQGATESGSAGAEQNESGSKLRFRRRRHTAIAA